MNHEKTLYPVKNYKDTVFRKLFSDRKKLLSLYNAVNDTHYTKEEDFEIITLDNAIYMSMKNDLAFLMDFQMHLYEHQSTVNPNMPLRFLQYTAIEYEKLMDGKKLYKSRRVKIPAPQYIVFYNGGKPQPEEQILKLSDSYIKKQENPSLELKVRFLNINQGKNAEVVERCKELKEYMLYVDRVRKYLLDMDLETAVARAVDECIKEGILVEFLRESKAEVISMSILECDFEDIKEAVFEDAWECGLEEGREAGLVEGRA
ncbi:MAG: transposase, partial [Lachnospiraceae bacterium]|nr:transposase [Lachnospiraceae bacterium]